MRDNESKGPAGDVKARVSTGRDKTEFIEIGTAWESEGGNLTFRILSEPIAWRDPQAERFCVLQFRKGVQLVRGSAVDGERPSEQRRGR